VSEYQTTLSRVRHLGAAHNGTRHFWRQRLTALANIPLVTVFVFIVLNFAGAPYDQARMMISHPFVSGALALLILSVTFHMKLGMQVIVEDYVHGEALKFLLLIANNLFCALLVFATLFILLRLSLGF
jgi:succinate dehydrogenase / fumarate reductase membrane anchor subunit